MICFPAAAAAMAFVSRPREMLQRQKPGKKDHDSLV